MVRNRLSDRINCYVLPFSGFVSLIPHERNTSGHEIDCPGDTLSYNCSIQSNSEMLNLTWKVITPGQRSVNITYDASSELGQVTTLNDFTVTSLTEYTVDESISSILEITVDLSAKTITLQCFTPLLQSTLALAINSSGMFTKVQ